MHCLCRTTRFKSNDVCGVASPETYTKPGEQLIGIVPHSLYCQNGVLRERFSSRAGTLRVRYPVQRHGLHKSRPFRRWYGLVLTMYSVLAWA